MNFESVFWVVVGVLLGKLCQFLFKECLRLRRQNKRKLLEIKLLEAKLNDREQR